MTAAVCVCKQRSRLEGSESVHVGFKACRYARLCDLSPSGSPAAPPKGFMEYND